VNFHAYLRELNHCNAAAQFRGKDAWLRFFASRQSVLTSDTASLTLKLAVGEE